MSGEGFGMIFALPIIIGGAAIAGMGMAVYGVAKAGAYVGKAAYNYHQKKKAEQEEILKSGIRSDLSMLHADVEATLNSMDAMGGQLYQDMEKEMLAKNEDVLEILKQGDAESYQKYLTGIRDVQKEAYGKMKKMQESFDRDYAGKAKTELASIQANVDQYADGLLNQIRAFQGSDEQKDNYAADLAKKYLDETRQVLDALIRSFHDKISMPSIGESMKKQLNDAIDMYNRKNYEGAIAVAQALHMDIGEKLYELEKEDIDWDVAYQSALSTAEMVKVYLESQACFSDTAAKEIKDATGIEIPIELYDEEIADYADRDADGKNLYQELLAEIREISGMLDSNSAKSLSAYELRALTERLFTVLYPQALQVVQNAVMNMSNVFFRVQKANEFKEFLESKDFAVRLFYEDEENLTSDIGVAVYNTITKEKVVYTLSKQKPGENPNQVNLKYQLAEGDETDEARNRYYQDMIKEFTGAKTMSCDHSTIGKVSGSLTEKAKEQLQVFEKL